MVGQAGDVDETVGARLEGDERAERGGGSHAALDDVAHLGLAGEQADALDAAVAQLAVGGEDLDQPVLGHVDGALELGFHAADGLAALADDRADLLGVDADGGDARSEVGQLGPRAADGLGHLARG